jgi:hypothetical protein
MRRARRLSRLDNRGCVDSLVWLLARLNVRKRHSLTMRRCGPDNCGAAVQSDMLFRYRKTAATSGLAGHWRVAWHKDLSHQLHAMAGFEHNS